MWFCATGPRGVQCAEVCVARVQPLLIRQQCDVYLTWVYGHSLGYSRVVVMLQWHGTWSVPRCSWRHPPSRCPSRHSLRAAACLPACARAPLQRCARPTLRCLPMTLPLFPITTAVFQMVSP